MECYLNVAINFQASLCIQKHIYMHIYVHMFTTKTRMTTRARLVYFLFTFLLHIRLWLSFLQLAAFVQFRKWSLDEKLPMIILVEKGSSRPKL